MRAVVGFLSLTLSCACVTAGEAQELTRAEAARLIQRHPTFAKGGTATLAGPIEKCVMRDVEIGSTDASTAPAVLRESGVDPNSGYHDMRVEHVPDEQLIKGLGPAACVEMYRKATQGTSLQAFQAKMTKHFWYVSSKIKDFYVNQGVPPGGGVIKVSKYEFKEVTGIRATGVSTAEAEFTVAVSSLYKMEFSPDRPPAIIHGIAPFARYDDGWRLGEPITVYLESSPKRRFNF